MSLKVGNSIESMLVGLLSLRKNSLIVFDNADILSSKYMNLIIKLIQFSTVVLIGRSLRVMGISSSMMYSYLNYVNIDNSILLEARK